jgi:hypothetical protein
MLLLLVKELHDIALDAATARDRCAADLMEIGGMTDDEHGRLIDQAVSLRSRVEVLGYSEQALRLAVASLH